MTAPLAPIAVFAYRRPQHIAALLTSLRTNPEHEKSPIYVFLDGARGEADAEDVARTRTVAREYAPRHAKIIEREANAGLAASIISGVTRLVREYGRVIVLEDDLVLSPFTVRYFNDALERYQGEERVMHVAGYMFPVRAKLPETFFYREASCWGWATWERAWAKFEPDGAKIRDHLLAHNMQFEFDVRGSMGYLEMLEQQIAGLNDSWAIRWYGSVAMAGGLALHPGRSLIANRGLDGTGRHSHETNMFDVQLAQRPVVYFTKQVEEDELALASMIAFRQRHRTLPMRAYHRLFRIYRWAARAAGLT